MATTQVGKSPQFSWWRNTLPRTVRTPTSPAAHGHDFRATRLTNASGSGVTTTSPGGASARTSMMGGYAPSAVVAASSSRSLVAMGTASMSVCLTCEQPSVRICWYPSVALGAVTRFVTQSADLAVETYCFRRSL
jgi:hypothetical protein